MSINTFSPIKIFVVEDDPLYVRMIKYVMEMNPDHEVHVFSNGKECLANLHLKPSIISLDYSLPDMNGKEILEKIKSYNESIQVVILSGQKDINIAVQLLKNGAYEYIVKGESTKDHLMLTVDNLKMGLELKQEVEDLKEELVERYSFSNTIIGTSDPMIKVFKLLEKAIKTNISISISGETGTGKELVAKSIHYNSKRKKGNFIAVNVSAIPSELLESELFGYEKGAFTGAETRKLGQFELADQGTLFLDEIGELDISLQAKLLRAIQEREIMRVGGQTPIKFDTRIVVATHKSLSDEVMKGNFREDLYYRLLGLPIELPPLRERGKDILLLMKFFLEDFTKQNNLGAFSLTKEAKSKLLSYSFPGNVRELKAIIELAAVMADNNIITADDIRFNTVKKEDMFLTQEMSLKEYNKQILHHYLEKYNRDIMLVAKKLDIGKSTIYRMLKEDNLSI